jgi:hypothetical protein
MSWSPQWPLSLRLPHHSYKNYEKSEKYLLVVCRFDHLLTKFLTALTNKKNVSAVRRMNYAIPMKLFE